MLKNPSHHTLLQHLTAGQHEWQTFPQCVVQHLIGVMCCHCQAVIGASGGRIPMICSCIHRYTVSDMYRVEVSCLMVSFSLVAFSCLPVVVVGFVFVFVFCCLLFFVGLFVWVFFFFFFLFVCCCCCCLFFFVFFCCCFFFGGGGLRVY